PSCLYQGVGISGPVPGPSPFMRKPRSQRLLGADKKNKRPFGATPAVPLQRTWCERGGAGWGRGARQGGPLGTAGWATRWPNRRAHAQPYARSRHGAHMTDEPTRVVVGSGDPVTVCLASTGRRDGGWVCSKLQMAEDLADHRALRDDGDEPQG